MSKKSYEVRFRTSWSVLHQIEIEARTENEAQKLARKYAKATGPDDDVIHSYQFEDPDDFVISEIEEFEE